MKKILTYFSFALPLLFWSCHDTGPVLAGCCSKPGNFIDVGVGEISIANIFTPNGDAINDRLWVFGDSISEIIYLRIINSIDEVVFEVQNVPTDDIVSAWDGKIDGEVKKGIYTIELRAIAIDGYVANFTGQVCNFICDETAEYESVNLKNCIYGSQIQAFIDGYMHEAHEQLPCF